MRTAKRRDRFPSEPPDPVAEYREWTENRYNPGYWASRGNPRPPPSLKNLWSTKDRRWLGMLYIAAPLVGIILALRSGVTSDRDRWLLILLFAGIFYLAPGLIMLVSRDGTKKRTKKQ